jgi:hypothetical protein
MNPTGRIVGGGLVLIALLWILRIAGALPFSDRSTNQVAAQVPQDRPPIADFDASRTTIANFNPPTTTQPLNPDGTPSGNGSSTIADLTNPSTSGTNTTDSGNSTGSTTRPSGATTRPAIRGAW